MNQNAFIIMLLIIFILTLGMVHKYEVRLEQVHAQAEWWRSKAEQPPQVLNVCQKPRASTLTVTAYTNRPQETNNCPKTATMEQAVPGWTVAVSRDLIHWLGGRVYIEGVGVRRVNDLMHARHEKTLDLLVGTVGDAMEWGKQERMVVYLGL